MNVDCKSYKNWESGIFLDFRRAQKWAALINLEREHEQERIFFWISANARAQFFDGRTKALLSRHKMPTVRSNSSHMLAWLYGGEYERGTSLGP